MSRLTIRNIAESFVQEVPTGTINGTNTAFSLSYAPGQPGALDLTMDGRLLVQGSNGDYTISGSTITMSVAPAVGQYLYASYVK